MCGVWTVTKWIMNNEWRPAVRPTASLGSQQTSLGHRQRSSFLHQFASQLSLGSKFLHRAGGKESGTHLQLLSEILLTERKVWEVAESQRLGLVLQPKSAGHEGTTRCAPKIDFTVWT